MTKTRFESTVPKLCDMIISPKRLFLQKNHRIAANIYCNFGKKLVTIISHITKWGEKNPSFHHQ